FTSDAKPLDGELPASLKADLAAGAQESAQAYATLADFFENELAQHAPEKDAVGRELYALASRGFLGATVDLDETYEWGIEELARATTSPVPGGCGGACRKASRSSTPGVS